MLPKMQKSFTQMGKCHILLAIFLLSGLSANLLARSHSQAMLLDNQGKKIGWVKITPIKQAVLMEIKVKGLSRGKHGMHIHAIGDCSDHGKFKRSGGHLGKELKQHGFLNPQGHHQGDLPNLIIHRDGSAHVELYVPIAKKDLYDDDGSALVIHAQADDYRSQPIGGSGARIACAVIR